MMLQLKTTVSQELYDRFALAAEREQRSMSNLLRLLVERALAEMEQANGRER